MENCFEVACITAVRKTPWLFRLLRRDVQQYVSRGWKSVDGCPLMPRPLRAEYAQRHKQVLNRTKGGNGLALLLSLISVSKIPYVGITMAYDKFFDMQPEQRRLLVNARFSLVHLEIAARPKVENVIYVLDKLLIEEGIPLIFGFIHMMRKKGARHAASFTVCKDTSIVMCDDGACVSEDYDALLRYQKYRVFELVLAIHVPRARQADVPFSW